MVRRPEGSRPGDIVAQSPEVCKPRDGLGTSMLIGTPFPCRSAFGNAVEETLREQRASHGMSARQRTWVALCVRAVLVTHASCWGRFERARLGTDALAAFSWLLRHSKMPGHALLVARVRVILRHSGIPSGSLVVDETAHPRSQSAQPLAPLDKLRAKERGGLSGGTVWFCSCW